MGKVLGFILRKGAAEAEVATAPRPAPNPPPQPVSALPPPPPPAAPAASSRSASGEDTPDPFPEFTPARRQGSQVNLNKFFASAPVGLTAVLKQPSRMDLEASRSGGSVTLQTATSLHPAQQLPQQRLLGPLPQAPQPGGTDAPPSRPIRERRKSMTVSEIAASMQNIDVSQAAMIMMPTRLRQELAQSQSFTMQQQQQQQLQLQLQQALAGPNGGSGHCPQLSRSNAQLVVMSSGDLGSPVPSGGGGGGAVRTDRLERKPSIILEAVKHQQQRQQHQQQASEAHLRSHAGNFSGELHQATLAQLASALAGQGPERASGGGGGGGGGRTSILQGERRGSMVLSPPQQQQPQQQQLAAASSAAAAASGAPMAGGESSTRSLFAVSAGNFPPGPSSTGALQSQSPAVAPSPGALRRSEPGEPLRSRAVGGPPLNGVLSSARGIGRPLGPAAGGGGGGAEEGSGPGPGPETLMSPSGGGTSSTPPGYLLSPSGKEPRRSVVGFRASEPSAQGHVHMQEEDLQRQSSSTQLPTLGSSDVKLPVIGGGPGRRGGGGGGGANGDTRDKDAAAAGPGPRNTLSAADVAAITEAMSAYQLEATRLRAAALRKMDTRIKRAVMDRHMGPEDDIKAGAGGAGGHDNGGGGASGSKMPLLRSPVGAPSRSNLAAASSPGRSRGSLGGPLAAISGDLVNRGRGRPAG